MLFQCAVTTPLLRIIRNKRLNLALGQDEIQRRFVAEADILLPNNLPLGIQQHQCWGTRHSILTDQVGPTAEIHPQHRQASFTGHILGRDLGLGVSNHRHLAFAAAPQREENQRRLPVQVQWLPVSKPAHRDSLYPEDHANQA